MFVSLVFNQSLLVCCETRVPARKVTRDFRLVNGCFVLASERTQGHDCHSLVDGLGSLVRVERVAVLVHTQVVQRREVAAAHVATVLHLCLVTLGVLQKRVELLERLPTVLHDALVNLCAVQKTDAAGMLTAT